MKRLWKNATKTISNEVVQNLMEGIVRKARLYGRQVKSE